MRHIFNKGLVLVIIGLFTVGSALAQQCEDVSDVPQEQARRAPADNTQSVDRAEDPEATSAQTPTRVDTPPCTPGTQGCG